MQFIVAENRSERDVLLLCGNGGRGGCAGSHGDCKGVVFVMDGLESKKMAIT